MIGDENEGGDCDEVNQEQSKQNEVDGMKKDGGTEGVQLLMQSPIGRAA